jgi:AcrR family transcriptional regulator
MDPWYRRRSYEGATIRGIALQASINPSLAIRYFGSKEGLFAAVATLDFKARNLSEVSRAELGEALVKHVLDLWDSPKDGAALTAMMRASITYESARERFAAQFTSQIVQLFTPLGREIAPAAPYIATQILGLAMARYIWRIPAVTLLPKEQVIAKVGETLQRYLDA